MKISKKELEALKTVIERDKDKVSFAKDYFVTDKKVNLACITNITAERGESSYNSLSVKELEFNGTDYYEKTVALCDYMVVNGEKGKHIFIVLIEVLSCGNYNRGYGSLILKFLEDQCKQLGIEEIRGKFKPIAPARPEYVRNFYTVNGFEFYDHLGYDMIRKMQPTFRSFDSKNINGVDFVCLNDNEITVYEEEILTK